LFQKQVPDYLVLKLAPVQVRRMMTMSSQLVPGETLEEAAEEKDLNRNRKRRKSCSFVS
jgi:hypothetical protein